MEGLIAEGAEMIEEEGDPEVKDAVTGNRWSGALSSPA
jgi:hypothetical protein